MSTTLQAQTSRTIASLISSVDEKKNAELRAMAIEALSPFEELSKKSYRLSENKKDIKESWVEAIIEGFLGEKIYKLHIVSVRQSTFKRLKASCYFPLVRDDDFMEAKEGLDRYKGPKLTSQLENPLGTFTDKVWESFKKTYRERLPEDISLLSKTTILRVLKAYVMAVNAENSWLMNRLAPIMELIRIGIPFSTEAKKKATWHLLID